MFRSATFKLTVWYLALAMTISIIFSVVVYHLATNEIARGLHLQTARIYNQFPVFDNSPILKPGSDIASGDHNLLLRLVFFNIIVLLLAGLASYFLAQRTLRPIEEAHEQQKRFTADVSHELRTPLTALKMESEVALLSPNTSQKELRKILESNLEEVSKLEGLINNLLRLTRLEADELRHNFTKISTIDIVRDAVYRVEKMANNRDIKIKQEIADLSIYGDQDSLAQLTLILLDNAVKYSGSGTTVNLKITANDNLEVILSIEDQGIGIDKLALEHIFDRFYRAELSRTKNISDTEGYGLGLSIAKMIADVHQAVITVSSQVNKGTLVEVRFPKVD
jgi:signal transduction histidine kinase